MQKTAFLFVCWMISCQLYSQNWVQVGDLNGPPRVMLNDTFSGKLLVSGNFRLNGTDTLDGFFAYDGTTFTSFGRRFDCVYFGCTPAFMIARYEEQLYFSGPSLTIIDGVPVNGIGRWDGETWSDAMQGLYYTDDNDPYLDNYCIHEGDFYGVGAFRTAEGDTCNSVARWDGERWTGLDFPPYSDNSLPRVTSVIFYQDQLYVAGNFSWELGGGGDVARLNSTGWQMVGGGLRGGQALVSDVEVYKGELYICGYFRKIDGNVGNGIMRWDGQQWKEVGGSLCSPSHITRGMTVHDGKLLLYGIFNCVGDGLPVNNIAAWDGERWCSFGNSTFDNSVSRLVEYNGDIYIGGGFVEIDDQPVKYFAKWVGDHATDTCSAPVSSTPEPRHEGFGVWPNPATDLLQVQAPAPMEALWVHDAQGREVLRPVVSGERASVSVEHLPVGLYFVSLRAGGKIWGGKFVKG
jgi:hypothetical protein